MADGQWPRQNGQQEWPDDGGWPDDGRSLPPWRSAQQGDARRLGPYGQPRHDERGPQGGGDGRWQPPEWRYGQQRHPQENGQRGYASGQYQPQPGFQPAPPPQQGQWGYVPPSPQPPYRPHKPHQPHQPPRRGKSWPARHKALTGIFAFMALIIIIVAANAGGSSPTGGTTAGLTTTASATAAGVPSQHPTQAGTAVRKTHQKSVQTTSATAQAPAPPVTAPTTAAAAVVAPPASAAPAGCHPLTNGGNCYEPGEYCRDSDHDASGVAGDGKAITCEDNDGWRWEPA
jgi:hypothetical protein